MKVICILLICLLCNQSCKNKIDVEQQIIAIQSPSQKKEIEIPFINRSIYLPSSYKLIATNLTEYLDQRNLTGNSKILILAFMQKYQDQGLQPSFLIDSIDIHQQIIAFAIDSTTRTSERIVASAISSGIKNAQPSYTYELHEEFRNTERRVYKSSFAANDTTKLEVLRPIQIYTVFDNLGGFVLLQRGMNYQKLEEYLLEE